MRRRFNEGQMSMRQERMLGVALLVAGLAIAGVAVSQMGPEGPLHAQATAPATPSVQDDRPETRPTTPAPEPARPQNNEGSTTGTSPASPRMGDRPPVTGTPLPPAPAEKMAPPIQSK